MEERHMAKLARKRRRERKKAKNLAASVRDFLTPTVMRQVRKSMSRRKKPRWDLYPLIHVLLVMTWCCGDSLPEKFETARGFYVVCCPKRKRPGKSFQGFEKAVRRLPMPVLRSLAEAVRGRIKVLLGDRLLFGGFIPLGCDGTKHECPRTEELERRLSTVCKQKVVGESSSAPTIWNTSIVHLTLGIPWCWRWGKGKKSSERTHLIQMLPLLPRLALIVTDAGYVGYEVIRVLLEKDVFFLMRMSSQATFYTENEEPLESFQEGIAYYWPHKYRATGKPPLRGRLICVRSERRKINVWLFTNVEDPNQLSLAHASKLYRLRWESEGFFRTYKRTLKKVKLMSRTVRSIHREAEASMIATQIMLCLGASAMPAPSSPKRLPVMSSPRKVLLEIRHDLKGRQRKGKPFSKRIAKHQRERRDRRTEKEKREWARRKTHKPPQPPKVLRITSDLKSEIAKYLTAA
jgi:hypothetical protein